MQNSAENKTSIFVTTSGRYDYLAITLGNFRMACGYEFDQKFIVNDCVDKDFKEKLQKLAEYFGFEIIQHDQKEGFAGAYHTAFTNVNRDSDYCFILEDDFTFNERVDIKLMAGILKSNPHLCQIALKRQAWHESEKVAGGIVEQWPDLYTDMENDYGIQWCEHRQFFTTNPSLVPAWVIDVGWPRVAQSEKVFSNTLFENPDVRSAYLGEKFAPPKVTHIGEERKGTGY